MIVKAIWPEYTKDIDITGWFNITEQRDELLCVGDVVRQSDGRGYALTDNSMWLDGSNPGATVGDVRSYNMIGGVGSVTIHRRPETK